MIGHNQQGEKATHRMREKICVNHITGKDIPNR